MSLLDFCQWLHDTPAADVMRHSSATFTVINSIHALGIVLVAGTILLVDLRLLELSLRSESVKDVVSRIVPLTLSGFAIMALTGLLMFFPEAVRYYNSPAFRIKLVLLALLGLNALIFHLTVYRDAPKWESGPVPVRARLAGLFSLLLWIGVIAAGRSIPYGKDYDLGFNGAPTSLVARCLPVSLIQWIQGTWLDAAIRHSAAAIRIAEVIHLLGLALFGGTVFVLNLVLFGFGPPRRSLSRIAGELLPWTVAGFIVMAISGSVLFLSSPEKFYENPALRIKLALLSLALIFQFTIHRKIASADPPAAPGRAVLAACLSSALWIGIGFAGKAIGPYAVQ